MEKCCVTLNIRLQVYMGEDVFSDKCISEYYSKVFWDFFFVVFWRRGQRSKGREMIMVQKQEGGAKRNGIQGHWPCEREDVVVKQGEIK